MKTPLPLTLTLVTAVGIAAFFLGRRSVAPETGSPTQGAPSGPQYVRTGSRPGQVTPDASEEKASSASASASTARMDPTKLTAAQAAKLSKPERMAMIKKGALIFDAGKQADYLCGVIAALGEDEISEAISTVGAAQDRGNFAAQAVWDALWTQSGRVKPLETISGFVANPGGKRTADFRLVMAGWLEVDHSAAMAWANQPKENLVEAAVAAQALTESVRGDADQLRSLIQTMPTGDLRVKECMQDLFDISASAGGDKNAAETYEKLSPELRAAAWTLAMKRLNYTDPQIAVDWLNAHAKDAGRDYSAASPLIRELAKDDPAGTARWAAGLPFEDAPATGDSPPMPHPAQTAVGYWLRQDPQAARAWLQTQSTTQPWAAKMLSAADARGTRSPF